MQGNIYNLQIVFVRFERMGGARILIPEENQHI